MHVFNHKQSPVLPYTFRGTVLVAMIRMLYGLLSVLWKSPFKQASKDIEECPAHMNASQVLFLGFKYYYRAIWHTNPELVQFYKNQGVSIRSEYGFNTQKKHVASLSIGGDLMPYRRLRDSSPEVFWKECGEWFFDADLVFANLETPIDGSKPTSDVPEVMLYDMYFNADETYMDLFEGRRCWGRGYDVLSVANNHSLDQGAEGLEATLAFLKQKGIKTVGAASKARDKLWHMFDRNGIKISVHSFTYSLNKCELPDQSPCRINHARLNLKDAPIEILINEIQEAREAGSEFPLLYLHMGNAYMAYPLQHIRDNLRRIAEATKVPLILCGHGHNVQPAEIMGDTLVFHSLGDFVGYDIYKGCRFSLALKLHLYKLMSGNVSFQFEAKLLHVGESESGSIALRFANKDFKCSNAELNHWFEKLMGVQNFLPH